jgi:hypothetical protein
MSVDRGISTPIDVVLGLLLVAVATGVVATAVPAPPPEPPSNAQAAILGSSLTVTVETDAGTWTSTQPVGAHVADAARVRQDGPARETAYREAVVAAVRERIATHNLDAQVVGFCPDHPGRRVVAGPQPPADRPVRATSYAVPAGDRPRNQTPVVVLRRWSA